MKPTFTSYQLSNIFLCLILICIGSNLSAQCCSFIDSGQAIGENPTFGVALGDLDNDGDLDAITIEAYVDIKTYFNDGNGQFTLNQTITPQSGEESNFGVNLLDVDNDGDLDAIVAPFYASNSLKIYRNNGTGNFSLLQSIASNTATRYLAVGDVDGDNKADLFVANTSGGPSKIYHNNGNGTFIYLSEITVSGANDVTLADVDGDGDLDAIIASGNYQGVQVLLNDSSGFFTNSGQTLGDTNESYYAIGAADFDGDGDQDFVVAGSYFASRVFYNNGTGQFTQGTTLPGANYDMHIRILDYDQDSDPDIFISNYGSNGIELWQNKGNQQFELCFTNASPLPSTYSHGFDIGKLNADGAYDLFLGQFGNSGNIVLFGDPGWTTDHQSFTICQGQTYTFPDQTTSTTSSVHVSNLLNVNGCDSTILTVLTVIPVDTSVVSSTNSLMALAVDSKFQWLDCDQNFAEIPGATNQSFSPAATGNYAVAVTHNGCTDISGCFQVIISGTENLNNIYQVYPNPLTDNCFVAFTGSNAFTKSTIKLYDAFGQKIWEHNINEANLEIPMKACASGIYFLEINNGTSLSVWNKLIKR